MSINYSPNELAPCYRPLQYSTTKTRVKATPLVYADVQVVPIGTATIIKSVAYPTSVTDNATNPTTESDVTFVFDVAKIVQEYFMTNASVLPTPFTSLSNTGAVPAGDDVILQFGISVAYYYRDSDGLLKFWTGQNDIASNFYFVNATVQHTEDFELTDYIATSPTVNYMYSATKNRNKHYTCLGNPFYISQITDDTITPADIAFAAYKNGALVGAGLIPSQTTSSDPNVYVKDVGSKSNTDATVYANLSSSGKTAIGVSGAFDATLSDSSTYDCVKYWFGVAALDGEVYNFTPLSASLTDFDPVTTAIEVCYIDCCNKNRALQVYWINEFGVVDSYVFNSQKKHNLKSDGKFSVSGLSYNGGSGTPHNVNQSGRFKHTTKASEKYKLTSQLLVNSQMDWIKYLLVSPTVFAYIDGQFIPFVVENGEFLIGQEKGRFSLEVDATFANDLVTHRR